MPAAVCVGRRRCPSAAASVDLPLPPGPTSARRGFSPDAAGGRQRAQLGAARRETGSGLGGNATAMV